MFKAATILAALCAVASAAPPHVQVTRESCNGVWCEAHLERMTLNSNDTMGENATALFLTGVSDYHGAWIDPKKVQCDYVTDAATNSTGFFSLMSPAIFSPNSTVLVKYVFCNYNVATPGKL